MNDIEKKFFNAYKESITSTGRNYEDYFKEQVQVGPYIVDFTLGKNIVIEIDGHEFHKTKEQRFKDYTRERYLMKQGYHVIRFMGTEIFIDPMKCLVEVFEIANAYDSRGDNYGKAQKTSS